MNAFQNIIKCAICREIIESPVILPCNDNICKKHVSNQANDVIRCEKCGVEHRITANGFQPNNALKDIIETKIANLNFGSVHKEATESCELFGKNLREFEVLLQDPPFYTYNIISELKNNVYEKGEELKLKIDQEIDKLIKQIEKHNTRCAVYLKSDEINQEIKRLENVLKTAQSNLNSWLESLNEIKLDEDKWKSIIEESNQVHKCITEEMDKLKNNLLMNNFDLIQNEVNCFKSIKIDSLFEFINRDFLVSTILNQDAFSQKLEKLLFKKDLNGQKWSLLYRGSRDGFQASDFHFRCDHKPNTLTIVKSTNGNIFGGFTTAEWKSPVYESSVHDKSAFIFSLINKQKRPLIFEHSSASRDSVFSDKNTGPAFGGGKDMFLCDNPHLNNKSHSDLGFTFTHPDYKYLSYKARNFLAGSYNFQVQEIEVFQMQPKDCF